MDRLKQRVSVAERAVGILREVALRFLALVEGIDAGSPKSAIRACQQAGFLTAAETEQALVMADDRNLTAHTYNERLAEAIFARLPQHLITLESWLAAMRGRLPA